jgi:hypothetical protein
LTAARKPSLAERPRRITIPDLIQEADRVFGSGTIVRHYGKPHYLPMVQVDGPGTFYIRVSGMGTVAECRALLGAMLRALPAQPPKRKRGVK